jgi:outer membrane protein assembly factor BamE
MRFRLFLVAESLVADCLADSRIGAYGIRSLSIILLLITALASSACSIHRVDVQQGNAITKEQIGKLRIGMAKKQVSQIMGTPLIDDPFHQGRWDYYYKFIAGDSDETQSSYVTLYFDGDRLSKINIHKEPQKETNLMKSSIKVK